MNVRFLLVYLSLIFTKNVFCQTFNGIGGQVVDDGKNFTEFKINITNVSKDTLNSSYGLLKVCFNLTHANNQELSIWLISPDNISVKLTERLGGNSVNFQNTCLDMSSVNYIAANWGPFTGTFRPYHHLGVINSGGRAKGTWKLRIKDHFIGNRATLLNWSIQLGNNAAAGISPYTSSNLPVFRIITNNTVIVDDPKRIVDFELIDNPSSINRFKNDTVVMKGKIGIEFRGSSSQWFPKKSYGFEFLDSGLIETKRSILNMPEESDWILSASFTDKSFMNNVMAYDHYRKMGHYASRTRYVELVIDDEYQGLYVLMEKIKQDNNRVDISKLDATDTSAMDITGGYIFKIDKFTAGTGAGWTSHILPDVSVSGQQIYYQYDYPNPSIMSMNQQRYIQSFMKTFEDTLKSGPLNTLHSGWRNYAEELTFIHYFLLNELSRNTDGYRLSTYLFKSKNKKDTLGKLSIGPPWDYDIAFGNINYCLGQETTGWAYKFGEVCSGDGFQVPFWWKRLLQDSLFNNKLRCEYDKLRKTIWSDISILQYIDSTYNIIGKPVQANLNLWPILGLYIWPNPNPIPTTVEGEKQELKNWMIRRLAWLDKNIPGQCIITKENSEPSDDENFFTVIPNPALDRIKIEVKQVSESLFKIELLNLHGQMLYSSSAVTLPNEISLQYLPNGVYQIRLIDTGNKRSVQKLLIQRP